MRMAIVGLGFIGRGWLRLAAGSVEQVRIYDVVRSAIAEAEAEWSRLSTETDLQVCSDLADAVGGADYVQECLPEGLELKRAVLGEMDRHADPDTVIASSTSSFLADQLSSALSKRDRFVVAHPMNPPDLIPVVEIVGGEQTTDATLDRATLCMEKLGRVPIRCADVKGFVVNRLQCALEREAFGLLRDGVADAAAIERAVKDGLGARWSCLGPFGVEATNASGLGDAIEKYGAYFEAMFEEIDRPFGRMTEAEVDQAENGLSEVYGTADPELLQEYRNYVLETVPSAIEEIRESICESEGGEVNRWATRP